MSNFVRMFKPRFAALVEAGTKLQTVRPVPSRLPGPGDTISLRTWTGKPYRSKMRLLREARITAVVAIEISEDQIHYDNFLCVARHNLDNFANADGFKGWIEMREWFRAEHGLPFKGILIQWEPKISA